MSFGLIGLLLAINTVSSGTSPVAWSPDGQWIAYTTLMTPATRVLPKPGWIFETKASQLSGLGERPTDVSPAESTEVQSVLQIISHDGQNPRQVEVTRGRLSTPAWRFDGEALAFSRIVRTEGGGERFEVLIHDSSDKSRVIYKEDCQKACSADRIHHSSDHSVQWSPDGRYLAVPVLVPDRKLLVIRADNGRLIHSEPDGYWPCWSPDGSKLAFVRGDDASTIALLDTSFGPSRNLVTVGRMQQGPQWSKEGRWLFVMSLRPSRKGLERATQIENCRVSSDTGDIEIINQIHNSSLERGAALRNSSFALSQTGDDLFYSIDIDNQAPAMVWFRPRTWETIDLINPVDSGVKISVLGLSPNGKEVALRFGRNPTSSVVAVLEILSKKLTLLISSDAARIEWIKILASTSRLILKNTLITAKRTAMEAIERPTIFPVPGEIAWTHEVSFRLRRLSMLALPICQQLKDTNEAAPEDEEQSFLNESRFFFEILGDQYQKALVSLEAMEANEFNSDDRLKLLNLRAQLYLANGDEDAAKDVLTYLRANTVDSISLIESTPLGYSVQTETQLQPKWYDYLEARIEEWSRNAKPKEPSVPSTPKAELPQDNPFPILMPLQREPEPRAPFFPFPQGEPLPLREIDEPGPIFPEFTPRHPALK